MWRWYDAVVLGLEDDGSVRLWEPAHGEIIAQQRASFKHCHLGARAYASAGLPGANWWVAGGTNVDPRNASFGFINQDRNSPRDVQLGARFTF